MLNHSDSFLLFSFFRAILVIFLGVLFLRLFWIRRRYVSKVNTLPSYKLRFYHIFGHLSLALYIRMKKTMFPVHVYDFMLLNGYAEVFRKEKISYMWQFFHPFVMVYKADSVEVLLNHSTELKKAWFYSLLHSWLGTGLLTSNDTKWKNRRKLLTPAFHFNILRDFLPVFNKQSKILVGILRKHEKDEHIDIVPFITRCSFDIICESILGADIQSQQNPSSPYVKAVNELTSAFLERMQNPFLWPDFLFKLSTLGKKFYRNIKVAHDFTDKLISEKKAEKLKKPDVQLDLPDSTEVYRRNKRALLDLLLEEHINNNSINEVEIREEVDTFTFEGHDTTAMAMSWSLYLIGLHPNVQEKVLSEIDSIFENSERDATTDDLKNMKYLECVLKETLRIYPSVPVFGRHIKEDIKFQDRIIPKGSTCAVLSYVLHRDPEFFPNPEKFDPERFFPENSAGRHPFAYVPFSAGSRNCIGQKFALMEEKAVISAVLRNYKVRSLDPRDKVQLLDEVVLRPLNGLRVQIIPR